MMKQFQIAIDSMCVAAILSAGAPADKIAATHIESIAI